MKNKRLIVILCAVLVVLVAAFAAVIYFAKPQISEGDKHITVVVVHSDKGEERFEITTDAEYLGEAVYGEKLVSEEEYKSGFYLTVDGETADYNADGAWWKVTKNGEMINVGMNDQPIADGDKFEIIYTVG